METDTAFSHLSTLEGRVADGQRAQRERDQYIRTLVEGGMRQAEAWRALNKARQQHNLPEVTRAAVEAILRRTKSQTSV